MVAFSCCVFDGGDNEKKELDAAREKGWRGKFTRPGRVIRPGAIRMNGKCPLTPLEVCLVFLLGKKPQEFYYRANTTVIAE
jgi:hypothetical protein